MTFEQFDKFQTELFEECKRMRDTKGKEYAHSEDRFANFNRLADGLGLAPEKIAWVYAMKHKDSIESFLKFGRVSSNESIQGRFVDLIVYLTLIAGMVEESENSKQQQWSKAKGLIDIGSKVYFNGSKGTVTGRAGGMFIVLLAGGESLQVSEDLLTLR